MASPHFCAAHKVTSNPEPAANGAAETHTASFGIARGIGKLAYSAVRLGLTSIMMYRKIRPLTPTC